MNAALYIRVSTNQQIDRDSLKIQESMLRAFCKNNRHKTFKVYKDAGFSAKRDAHRPAFNDLINDIKSNKIQLVLVTKIDRISRSLKDLLNFIHFFHENDVAFIAVTQNIDTSGYMGRFTLNLLGTIAELEREVTAERVSEVMHHRASNGKWNGGIIPYGYTTQKRIMNELIKSGKSDNNSLAIATKNAPQEKVLYVDADEAKIVKLIFSTYNSTKSIRKTTRQLNAKGYKTRNGRPWSITTISRILTNPTYIGKLIYGVRVTDPKTGKIKRNSDGQGNIYDGMHEKIIKDSVFELTQEILGNSSIKRTRANQIYLLSRILKCGQCGRSMNGITYNKSDGRTYVYYKCSNNNVTENKCQGLCIPAERLEKFVVKTLMKLSKEKTFLNDKKKMLKILEEEAHPDSTRTKDELQKLITSEKDLLIRRENLLEALETKTIEQDVFQERFQNIKDLLQENMMLQADARNYSENIDIAISALKASFEEIASFGKNWEYLDTEGKAARLRAIVKQIVVTEEDMDIQLYLDGPGGRIPEKIHDKTPPEGGKTSGKQRKSSTGNKLVKALLVKELSQMGALAAIIPTLGVTASVPPTRSTATWPASPAPSSIVSISMWMYPPFPSANWQVIPMVPIQPKCATR